MPKSRFALHGLAPPKFTVCALFLPLIHGLCAFFRPLLTPVSTAPFFASLSVHGLHFTVYAPSIDREFKQTQNRETHLSGTQFDKTATRYEYCHRPLNGLSGGAVFRHGGGALKQPIKQPTETLTSTLALMGRFPSLMGRFTDFVLRGRFTS